jgi:transposase-like protein
MEWVVRKKRTLTTQQREEIVQRYLDGEAATKLALEYGVTAGTLRSFLPSRPKTYSKV